MGKRFDPGMARAQLTWIKDIHQRLGAAGVCYLFPIIAKQEVAGSKTVRFTFNPVQRRIEDSLGRCNLVLKARQMGITTYFALRRGLLSAILTPGTTSLLIAHQMDVAAEHMRIIRGAIAGCGTLDQPPPNVPPFQDHLLALRVDTRFELVFEFLDSKIVAETAGNREVGQGLPGVNHLHVTEFARWPGDAAATLANASAAVTPDGTIDIESTAHGWGGCFFELWNEAQNGRTQFTPHFFPWWLQPEYRLDDPQERASWLEDHPELTEEERLLKQKAALDLAQLAWRRKAQTGYRRKFPEQFPEDPNAAFLSSGSAFFDQEALRRRALEVQAGEVAQQTTHTIADGTFTTCRRPLAHHQYILHADVAWGRTEKTRDPDWSAFTIIDRDTGEQVAFYRAHVSPEDFADHIRQATDLYWQPLVSIERNPGGGGESVLLTLRSQFGYGNIYEHKEWDKDRKNVLAIPGLPMTEPNRILALNRLGQEIRTESWKFHDPVFLQEAMTFVRKPNGKPEAAPGCHDDTVMAAAGAHLVRWISLSYYDPLQGVPVEN